MRGYRSSEPRINRMDVAVWLKGLGLADRNHVITLG